MVLIQSRYNMMDRWREMVGSLALALGMNTADIVLDKIPGGRKEAQLVRWSLLVPQFVVLLEPALPLVRPFVHAHVLGVEGEKTEDGSPWYILDPPLGGTRVLSGSILANLQIAVVVVQGCCKKWVVFEEGRLEREQAK